MPIPRNNNGSILIRFTHNGYRFVLGRLGKFTDPIALSKAKLICRRIELDIDCGQFIVTNNDELEIAYHPSPKPKKKPKPPKIPSLIELLDRRLDEKFHSTDRSLMKLLRQYGKSIKTEEDAQLFADWLSQRPVKATTTQRYLNSLKAISPLFANVKKLKRDAPNPIKPFSKSEVVLICDWFDRNYLHFGDFVRCLFLTGMRTSEAIGLRWGDIDFENRVLTIKSSLVSNRRNSQRIRKSTKTGIARSFPLSGKLLQLFESRHVAGCDRSQLIFTSSSDKPIDDKNFSQRIWRRCLAECGIPHRSLYHTRHTFISHCLANGMSVIEVASLTHGSRSGAETILRHYAGLIDRPSIPDLY